ncbi:MAG: hypothetical protein RH946_12185 [Rhodospirillales bacterium]
MEFLLDPDVIKLSALGCAFVVGVCVCVYVAIRETAELKRRRRAKRLIYEDEIKREIDRKKHMMDKLNSQRVLDGEIEAVDSDTSIQRSNNQSFA